jgi:hypothetical protein
MEHIEVVEAVVVHSSTTVTRYFALARHKGGGEWFAVGTVTEHHETSESCLQRARVYWNPGRYEILILRAELPV